MKLLVPGSIMLVGDAASESLRKFCGAATGSKANEVVSVCFICPPLEMLFTGYTVVVVSVMDVTLNV